MRKFTIAVIAVVALMLFSSMLLAQEHKEIKMHKEYKRTCLDLDDAQKAKLHELKYQLQVAVIDLKADLQKLELEIKHEMMKDEPSKKAVDKLVTDIFATKAKMKKLHIDLAFKAKEFLKPEQWKKFIKQHMQKGHGGKGCCGSGGHGGMLQKRMKILRGGGCGSGHGSCCGHGGEHGMIWMEGGRGERAAKRIEIIKEEDSGSI